MKNYDIETLVKENNGLRDSIKHYKNELRKYKRAVQEVLYIRDGLNYQRRFLDYRRREGLMNEKDYERAIFYLEKREKDCENILQFIKD